jgi:hypothetical protein
MGPTVSAPIRLHRAKIGIGDIDSSFVRGKVRIGRRTRDR